MEKGTAVDGLGGGPQRRYILRCICYMARPRKGRKERGEKHTAVDGFDGGPEGRQEAVGGAALGVLAVLDVADVVGPCAAGTVTGEARAANAPRGQACRLGLTRHRGRCFHDVCTATPSDVGDMDKGNAS